MTSYQTITSMLCSLHKFVIVHILQKEQINKKENGLIWRRQWMADYLWIPVIIYLFLYFQLLVWTQNIFFIYIILCIYHNRIGGVMVSVIDSSAVYRGFEPRSGQTKDYKIGICCFSTKHAALRSKSKDWMARNQNNVSEWSDMSTRWLLFQWASTLKNQLRVFV